MIPARIDYQLTPKHTLFARYLYAGQDSRTPYSISPTSIYYAGAQGTADNENAATLGDTYLISPTMVNSVRLFGNRINTFAPGASYIDASTLGIPMYSYLPGYFEISVSGAFGLASGTTGGAPDTKKNDTNFGLNDDFTESGLSPVCLRRILHPDIYAEDRIRLCGREYYRWRDHGSGPGGFHARQDRHSPPVDSQSYELPAILPRPVRGRYLEDHTEADVDLWRELGPLGTPSFMHGEVYNFSLANFYSGLESTVIPTAPPGFSYPGDPGFHGNSGVAPEWANFDPRVGLAGIRSAMERPPSVWVASATISSMAFNLATSGAYCRSV